MTADTTLRGRIAAALESAHLEWMRPGSDAGERPLVEHLTTALLPLVAAEREAGREEFPGPFQVWPLARVLADVAVGSGDWTWDEEWADLDARHAATGYLDTLEQQIRENGITMPVLIGNDGRLWDGHHRLRIAVRIGIPYVPVEVVPPGSTAAHADATGEHEPARVRPPVPCEGFVWIGQPFTTCDRCGQPAWEHAGEEVPAEGAGPFDGQSTVRPWEPGQADRIRARWETTTDATGGQT